MPGEGMSSAVVTHFQVTPAPGAGVEVDHIDRYGETSAQRLFTRAFVADVQRLSRLGHLSLVYSTWERS